jgi:hypothetical protein
VVSESRVCGCDDSVNLAAEVQVHPESTAGSGWPRACAGTSPVSRHGGGSAEGLDRTADTNQPNKIGVGGGPDFGLGLGYGRW